jgi:two-component system OmpR family response regulator
VYKILCVDDNVALVEVLTDMLRSLNFEPHAATGGQECLDLLKKGDIRPDIILLDIMMAPMDGWATLRHIRGDKDISTIPVMMLTGKYPTMSEVNEYSSLFEGYLMKPFALNSLSVEIEEVLDCMNRGERIIQQARENGVDETTLNDYRRLSSTAHVLNQFEGIITDGTFTRALFIETEKRLESIVQMIHNSNGHSNC